MNNLVTLIVGLIFGFGLALAGMTHPQKVLGFLDIAGQWDPSLLFVLGGAVGVTVISFRFILKLKKPLLAPGFLLSNLHDIDKPLVVGSALFGIGWGISGYCPGPAIALFAAPNWELWVFFPALLLGYVLQRVWEVRRRPAVTTAPAVKLDSEPPACG
ncbi:MAG TPA: DUF6691 family protein [Sideroxyarcus sp.]|nr:DUF6691 family protein [Sideroxyarcus sp.]